VQPILYPQYAAVRYWGEQHGYVFGKPGLPEWEQQGRGKPLAGVAMANKATAIGINFEEAIIWCNALSEATGRNPIYYRGSTPLKDIRMADKWTSKPWKKGYGIYIGSDYFMGSDMYYMGDDYIPDTFGIDAIFGLWKEGFMEKYKGKTRVLSVYHK
jgi:hypothetical protein